MKSKVFFFIGTKAQALKCISLIKYLNNKHDVVIIDSGQHRKILDSIYSDFGLKIKRHYLSNNQDNISTYTAGLIWFFKLLISVLTDSTFNKSKSICIIHGDTGSTLLGLIWAKRNNMQAIHLESGLTSNKIFNPFPEEIIRRIVARFSNILICFDNQSFQNLLNKYQSKKKFIKQVSENTISELLSTDTVEHDTRLITVTMHRTENLISKKNFKKFIQMLNELSNKYNINWYLHEPTENYLNKYKVHLSKNIATLPLLKHSDFIAELKKSSFVITDGGSIQEECYFLKIPAIIWRKYTERPYALNDNMLVSKFDTDRTYQFIDDNINKFLTVEELRFNPSEEIYLFLKSNNFV